MPKQSKTQPQVSPAKLTPATKDSTSSSKPPKNVDDWKVKNARAKELIMSTLEPGSEPWKIAEPLEFASDIWKALEARYAPNGRESIAATVKAIEKPVTEKSSVLTDSVVSEFSNAVAELEYDAKLRKEVQARAAKEFYDSMPNRDHRFLWAVLHGGKEETNAWFYGSADT